MAKMLIVHECTRKGCPFYSKDNFIFDGYCLHTDFHAKQTNQRGGKSYRVLIRKHFIDGFPKRCPLHDYDPEHTCKKQLERKKLKDYIKMQKKELKRLKDETSNSSS